MSSKSSGSGSGWSNAGVESIRSLKSEPVQPVKTETFIQKRVGKQTREFETIVGRGRSLSTSNRHEQRLVTYDHGNKTRTDGPWVHMGDTNRKHVHPGGTEHTPTNAPGMIGGSTSTPTQRLQLDLLPSTTSPSTTVWD